MKKAFLLCLCGVILLFGFLFVACDNGYGDLDAAETSNDAVSESEDEAIYTFEPETQETEAPEESISPDEPVVLMYAADGRTNYVPQSEVEANKSVGWYTEPVVLMYAADGRTNYVPQSEVEANKSVGWYTEPVVLMYAADGRTNYVPQSEVEANKKVGWYTEPPKKSTSSSKGKSSGSSGTNAQYSGTVYITPSGKRYHYSATCGGKNSYPVSLDSAKAMGKTPCGTCVLK